MSTLYNRFHVLRKAYNISWELLEQDYLLSWVLAGIAHTSELREILIFKGGTALKKTYFGDYRFSQDLDFTLFGKLPTDIELECLMNAACQKAMKLQSDQGKPIRVVCEPYIQKTPHPNNQKAFTIMSQLPWQHRLYTRIMVDITTQEPLLLPPEVRDILHDDYQESISGTLKVYRLEEILAEKIRAIIEYAEKLHERGWGRSRVRDYFDIWRILKAYKKHIDIAILPSMVIDKCAVKKVIFSGPHDLFADDLIEDLDDAWLRWLDPYVPNLPSQHIVLTELKELLEEIWVPEEPRIRDSK